MDGDIESIKSIPTVKGFCSPCQVLGDTGCFTELSYFLGIVVLKSFCNEKLGLVASLVILALRIDAQTH